MPDKYFTELQTKETIKQFQEELATWKNMLHSRMEDNILMKNMLGDLLKVHYGINYLEEIEEFQNSFIREDEITDLLRNDVTRFDSLSYSQVFKNEQLRESCKRRLKKLRKDMILTENHFCALIASFDDFVYKIAR